MLSHRLANRAAILLLSGASLFSESRLFAQIKPLVEPARRNNYAWQVRDYAWRARPAPLTARADPVSRRGWFMARIWGSITFVENGAILDVSISTAQLPAGDVPLRNVLNLPEKAFNRVVCHSAAEPLLSSDRPSDSRLPADKPIPSSMPISMDVPSSCWKNYYDPAGEPLPVTIQVGLEGSKRNVPLFQIPDLTSF